MTDSFSLFSAKFAGRSMKKKSELILEGRRKKARFGSGVPVVPHRSVALFCVLWMMILNFGNE